MSDINETALNDQEEQLLSSNLLILPGGGENTKTHWLGALKNMLVNIRMLIAFKY